MGVYPGLCVCPGHYGTCTLHVLYVYMIYTDDNYMYVHVVAILFWLMFMYICIVYTIHVIEQYIIL